VAHLILGYTPIFLIFQAPKYVIKANDSWLHRISVAYEGFVVPEGIPILEGTPLTRPLFVATPSVGASLSQLILKEEEEEEEEEKEEEKKKSRGDRRFVKFLRGVWSVQPGSISRGYTGWR